MGKWIRNGLTALALILAGMPAWGADNRIVNINLFTQNDLRAMSMGNAYGPVARSEGAVFYNPAGLAQYNFDFKAEYSVNAAGTAAFATDTQKALSSSASQQSITNYLTKYEGTNQRFNYGTEQTAIADLGYADFGVGFGSLDQHRYTLQFADTGIPNFIADDTLNVSDNELKLSQGAVGFQFGKGKFLLGIAAKSFTYSEKVQAIPFATIVASGQLKFDPVGVTYPTASSYDIGALYRLEFWPALKPQMSFTAYNVGGVTLKKTGFDTIDVPASYNWGIAFGPDTGPVHWVISAEIEDISDALKVTDRGTGVNAGLQCTDPLRTKSCVNQPRSLLQRSHVGAEIGFWRTPTGNNIISLRAGDNRGYATYGAEINLWLLRILYAKGADNLGWQNNVDKFDFTAYQVGIAIVW